jgi:hypothetical protein
MKSSYTRGATVSHVSDCATARILSLAGFERRFWWRFGVVYSASLSPTQGFRGPMVLLSPLR